MIEYLKDCIRELTNDEPDQVHDFYLNRLRGRYAMTERYPESEATSEAYYAIIDAYNAADDVRELLDFHFEEAYVEDASGNLLATEKYSELVSTYWALVRTAEELVDALDEE